MTLPGRRSFLAGGAGIAALALGCRAWDRGVWASGEGPAYAPWLDWRSGDAGGATRPLRAAILAANPHDTQPWLFRVEDNAVTVFADRARNLGSFDPFRREMHLALGAAIENLTLAARADGLAASVMPASGILSLAPDERPLHVARILLTPMPVAEDALFRAIPARHTNRGPYRPDQTVSPEALWRLADLTAGDTVRTVFITDPSARAELGALIVEATDRIIADPIMSADSARWFRTGRREIAAHRDGVTVDTAGPSPFITAMSKILPDLDASSADRYWLSITRDTQVPSAPVLGIILVRDRLDMRAAIEAGRAWQRLHLAATAAGLSAQPLNQAVECVDRDAMLGREDFWKPAIAQFAGLPGWEATFMFRLGVAERAAAPSPRRALAEVLTTGPT